MFAYVFKTRADPFAGPHQPLPRLPGHGQRTTRTLLNTRAHSKERIGQLLVPQGKDVTPRRRVRPGRHRRGGQAQGDARRRLARRARPADHDAARSSSRRRSWRSRSSPRPRATRTRSSPRCAASRRRTRRSTSTATTQTGEQIVAGLSQIHVEVIVDRMKARFGAEVDAQAAARALPGDDPRHAPRRTAATRSRPAAAASSATATSRSSRCPTARASSSSTRSRAA